MAEDKKVQDVFSDEIQLLPSEEVEGRKKLLTNLQRLILGSSFFLIFVELLSFGFMFWRNSLEYELWSIGSDNQILLNRVESQADIEESFVNLESSASLISGVRQIESLSSYFLLSIEQSIPVNVFLDSLVVGESISLKGYTRDYSAVSVFLDKLTSLDFVSDGEITFLTRSPEDGRIVFSIALDL